MKLTKHEKLKQNFRILYLDLCYVFNTNDNFSEKYLNDKI